jgi:preprotein translocase subunit Sec63
MYCCIWDNLFFGIPLTHNFRHSQLAQKTKDFGIVELRNINGSYQIQGLPNFKTIPYLGRKLQYPDKFNIVFGIIYF